MIQELLGGFIFFLGKRFGTKVFCKQVAFVGRGLGMAFSKFKNPTLDLLQSY